MRHIFMIVIFCSSYYRTKHAHIVSRRCLRFSFYYYIFILSFITTKYCTRRICSARCAQVYYIVCYTFHEHFPVTSNCPDCAPPLLARYYFISESRFSGRKKNSSSYERKCLRIHFIDGIENSTVLPVRSTALILVLFRFYRIDFFPSYYVI
jgi:hypothetical protein